MDLHPEMNNHIALIIDGVVQQMMLVDDRLAAILLSEPTIVDVTGEDGFPVAGHGFLYNEQDGTFSAPDEFSEEVLNN